MYKTQIDMPTTFLGQFLHKHAPLKTKIIGRNQAPFMTKVSSKAIMTRSRLRSK